MNINIVSAVFLICAAAAGVLALCLLNQEKRFVRHAVRTSGYVAGISPLGEGGQMVPVVSFVDMDGNRVIKTAQRVGAHGVSVGDEVAILYTRKKRFGLVFWNIFVERDSQAKPYRVYTFYGVILGMIALGLAAAGIFVLMR